MAVHHNSPHFRHVGSLINDLYVRSFAGLAAISTVQARIEDESLGQVIETYVGVSKTQVQRLHSLAASIDAQLEPATDPAAIDELRHAARDLAHGLLSGNAAGAAVKAMERLAAAKLELYREGGECLTEDAQAQAIMLAGEAEEAGFLDTLQHFHPAAQNGDSDPANTLSFTF